MPEVVRTVGRYGILRPIGRGGMGVVHLARQHDLDRLVALKELSALHAEDPVLAQRFVREARLAGSLTDANVVTVFDFFEREGLTPELLRAVSQRQLRLLVELCGEWPIPYRVQFPRPRAELEALAGFLALRTPLAPVLVRLLRERRVFVDHRGDILRIGPAPYVRDDQLAEAVSRLATLLVPSIDPL